MSGSERTGFAHYEFGNTAGAVNVEHVGAPRRPGRLDLLLQQISDRLPVTLRGRWRLDRRTGTALAAAVAVAAVVLGGWTLFRAQSKQIAQPQLLAAGNPVHRQLAGSTPQEAYTPTARLDGAPPAASNPNPMDPIQPAVSGLGIVVDVEGKVAKPGVIRLPTGSRVMDAIRAAGGALPGTDLAPLNQARLLNDGEQVLVGAPGALGEGLAAPVPTAHTGGRGKAPLTGPVHINTATADQLEQLPGVGPALAQRILDWRAQHGRFSSVGELQQVHGLGPNKFAALRQWVTL
jgi:competence protein ComEA